MRSSAWKIRLLGGLGLVVITILAGMVGGSVQPAHAGVWGPIEIVQVSCTNVTFRFYYDGLESRHLYLTRDPDQIRARAINQNTGQEVASGWINVPTAFQTITMSLSWSAALPQGTPLEIIVGQYNVNNAPPTIVDRDYLGVELHATTTSCGAANPCATCSTSGGVASSSSFLFNCTTSGVTISRGGVAVLNASFAQIAGPLTTATTSGRNQPITSLNGVSLWALKSNELQVHMDSNPDATKLIVPANVCGEPATRATATVTTTYTATGAYASGTRYVVQPGDNLFRISLRFGRSMDAVAAANGITNYALIYAGQVLIIP